jgi:hypothetical protein
MRTPILAVAVAGLCLTTGTLAMPARSHGASASAERDSAGGGCPSLSEAGALPSRPGGGRLRGDVDGDGRLDVVSIRYAPSSRASCGFILFVQTTNRTFAVRVPEWYKPPQDSAMRDWSFSEPYVAVIIQLSPRRAQIVVARWHGASDVGVSFYGLNGGKLMLLRLAPHSDQNTLSLFGSVGTGSTNARCSRGGPLTVLYLAPANRRGSRWFAIKSVYRLDQGTIQLTDTRTLRTSHDAAIAKADRWGINTLPFTGCIVARGKRL